MRARSTDPPRADDGHEPHVPTHGDGSVPTAGAQADGTLRTPAWARCCPGCSVAPTSTAPPAPHHGRDGSSPRAARAAAASPLRQWHVVHFFAGETPHDGDVASFVHARGGTCEDVEKLRGTDLLDDAVFFDFLRRAEEGAIELGVFGMPCTTFSIARTGRRLLRRRPDASMADGLSAAERAQVEEADELLWRACMIARAIHSAGGDFVFENPADRATPPAFWRAFAHVASLWIHPEIIALAAATGAELVTFPACALGASAQKFTSLLFTAGLASLHRLVNCSI